MPSAGSITLAAQGHFFTGLTLRSGQSGSGSRRGRSGARHADHAGRARGVGDPVPAGRVRGVRVVRGLLRRAVGRAHPLDGRGVRPRGVRRQARGLPVAVVTAEASGFGPSCDKTASYLRSCGADVTALRLADLGIHGNGHAMMLEKNNAEISAVITDWISKVL